MVNAPAEVAEAPASAPEVPVEETEVPATEPVVEDAAPDPEPAAELQVSVEPEKPDYITRADWEREKAEVAAKAAADAIEQDRRRRQTENARKAAAEKREQEDREEARDAVKAAFGAEGYQVPDETVYKAIDRVASKKAQSILASHADAIETVFDYIVAPITGQDVQIEDGMVPLGKQLAPKVQAFINQFVPQIEAKAREGYIPASELGKHVDAEIARRNAQKRQGTEELQRVEGTPSSAIDNSDDARLNRIISLGREQVPDSDREWWDARFRKGQ